ncbi:hypothetical protein SMI01S_21240 [Sphingobacterium mizutaii NBRC 14946 = DSM 11724]|uniref:Stress responsive A/B Barrel Domain n=2 Tax=Sphingobacterium mizutaii TaxID=1010 RepID=A0AAJ4XA20_9SPHI|nr:Dabb family protein [Sphingobacterium mizutaii]GEM68518.1 hypothetical protein SMI01S_21240 [Sphingobacterium mizutaii NBRC 14946 = DSM 11724]SDK88346.1 Stress responsive A/B Barrel Domain [Sphingobacterium mizutaii]SNV46445.1 Stress responsive A/B Barrel Domain [Sphingobacterium mizutaii]
MKRKNFITTILVGASSGALLSSCANESSNASNTSTADSTGAATAPEAAAQTEELGAGLIVHNVFFWLKEGITAEEEKDFMNFFEELKKVPGPKALRFGKPAPTTPRDVVDNSFSYYLLVTFNTMDDINTYEHHQIHLDAVDKFSKYWTKVQVKDAILM